MTVLSSEKQKGCAASSQNQSWKFAKKSTKSKTMKKVVENINVYAVVKNKKSIKNLVVKTKIQVVN